MAKVKNKTATKKRTYSKKKNIKIEKPIIIIGLIVLALIILSYITFGLYKDTNHEINNYFFPLKLPPCSALPENPGCSPITI